MPPLAVPYTGTYIPFPASTPCLHTCCRSAPYRIDFTSRPADLESVLAPGSSKQTCLVSAPASSTADTLLPQDLHYQVGRARSSCVKLYCCASGIAQAPELTSSVYCGVQ